jgi:hypothetical protein
MMLKNTTRIRGKKDGAVQMSSGMIGDFANLCSQIPKAAKHRIETGRRAISYDVDQLTAGA